MRKILIMLVAGCAALGNSASWADPGRYEAGYGDVDQPAHYDSYRETDRDAMKRRHERRREAAKARHEREREAAKARAEMEREERKHYEEMQRERRKHREETRRESREPGEDVRRERRGHRDVADADEGYVEVVVRYPIEVVVRHPYDGWPWTY